LLIACGAAKRLPEGDRGVLLAAAGTRVGRIASLSAAGVVATGVAQATLHLHAPADVLTTAWGRLVLAKAFVLALMLGWAARNRRALERDPSSVARGVGSELALAAAAVLAAAALAGAAPPI
jgi:putative copper export protein